MIRIFATWISLLFAVLAAWFAVSNGKTVTLGLWGLDYSLTSPLYIVVVLMLALGFGIGWTSAWLAAGKHRKDKRRHARRVAELESELDVMRAERAGTLPAAYLPASGLPAAISEQPDADRRPAA